MRFKVDENLPREAAEALAQAGHDARTVSDQRMSGAEDGRLAAVCKSESRILLTLDKDFADIRRFPPEAWGGCVILRIANQDKRSVLRVLDRLVKLFDRRSAQGELWIVEEDRVRIRERS